MELRKVIRARQARYGIWEGDNALPWTLRESFGECQLSIEAGDKGELIEVLPDDLDRRAMFNVLARLEGVRSWEEQDAWLRATYPEDFEEN